MKTYISILIFFGCSVLVSAQDKDCMLGLGGNSTETIIQVFQLNEEQIGKMNEWKAELSVTNKVFQEDIRLLFDTHPQSKTEDLEALATKYKVLKDKILENAKAYDIRLLELFNPKQYERYLELCAAAKRTPFNIMPSPFPQKEPKE